MKKKLLVLMMVAIMGTTMITGCGNKTGNTVETETQTTQQSASPEESTATDLKDHTLMIYCGAGMTEPFQKIADAFKEQTNCEVNVTFENAGQIQSQITTSKEGDMFIAGSQDEVEPVKDYVEDQKALVKHIPVLLVSKDNPKGITGLKDLTKDGVSFIMGDAESTPIGKIAKKALTEAKIFDLINIEATTTTAPQLATVIAAKEADAAIVWKENCNIDGVEIVDTKDMDAYVKTIPAVKLNCSKDSEALDAFYTYLDSDTAKGIWASFGYESAE